MSKPSKNPAPKSKKPAPKPEGATKENVVTDAATPTKLSDQIDALKRLGVEGLRKEFLRVLGRPTNSSDTGAMIARITERMVFGGKSNAGRPVGKPGTDAKAPTATTTPRPPRPTKPGSPFTADPRLPAVGHTITKEWRGKKLEVTVRADGLEFDGKTYRSLSAIASGLLGCPANGYHFFSLLKSQTARAAAAPKRPKGTPEQVASVAKAREARAAKVAARKTAKNPA